MVIENKAREGDRVKMTGVMRDDPAPIEVGDVGTVELVDDGGTAHVRWDSGRTLGLLPGDPFVVIGRAEP